MEPQILKTDCTWTLCIMYTLLWLFQENDQRQIYSINEETVIKTKTAEQQPWLTLAYTEQSRTDKKEAHRTIGGNVCSDMANFYT